MIRLIMRSMLHMVRYNQSMIDTCGQIYDRVRDDIKRVVETAFVDQVSRPEVQIAKKSLKIGFQGSPRKISK